MPGRPLTAIAVLGVLVCSATVGLEAVGVLFPASDGGRERPTEAILAQLDLDTDSMVAPTRPVDLPDEVAARDPVWYEPEPSPEPLQDAGGAADESPTTTAPEGAARIAAALTMSPQSLSPESTPDEEASPIEVLSPPWHPPAQQPTAQEPEPAVVVPAVQTAEPSPVRPQLPRLAKTERTRSVRASPSGYGGFGWPLLDCLTR